MEWMIVVGLVGASGYFLARHIRSTLRGGKVGTCSGYSDPCASCHLALLHDEKE